MGIRSLPQSEYGLRQSGILQPLADYLKQQDPGNLFPTVNNLDANCLPDDAIL